MLAKVDLDNFYEINHSQNIACSDMLLQLLITHHGPHSNDNPPPEPYRSIEPEWWPSMWFGDLVTSCKVGTASVGFIQDVIAKAYGVTRLDLISKKRTHRYVMPRQIAMYFARVLLDRPFPDIGRRFGARDHTTVIHAVQKISARCVSDQEFATKIAALRAEILA